MCGSDSIFIKQIIDDNRSRADRHRQSLQDLTDDRKSCTNHQRSTGAGRVHRANQTEKSNCEFSRGRFQVIIDHCRQSFRGNVCRCTALSVRSTTKRTRTGRNCDTIVWSSGRTRRETGLGTIVRREEQFRAQRIASSISWARREERLKGRLHHAISRHEAARNVVRVIVANVILKS